jgi:hypothetical protein
VVRLSGQPDHAIGHATISKPGLVGSTQGADRAPRVQSPRELPLTPTSSVDTSGAPAAPVDGTERASHSAPATRNLFDPATCCLQRRFARVSQLPLSWWEPVSASSGYRLVSVVSAPFCHAAGMTTLEVRSPRPCG